MEKDRPILDNGQELSAETWNIVEKHASRAQDHVIAELYRPAPGGIPSKGIIPYGFQAQSGTAPPNSGIVITTTIANPALLIYPFTAVIGPPQDVFDVSPYDAFRDAHTVVVASGNVGDAQSTAVNIDPTVSNNRIDLVYVQVQLEFPTETATRYKRDPATGVITQPNLQSELNDVARILVVKGTEAATPTYPALPADSPAFPLGIYNIPLAYVLLAHPNAGVVSKVKIHEVAPIISIAPTTGAATLSPGNQQYNKTGDFLTATPFQASGIPSRPETYVPPTMTGQLSKFFCFRWDGTPKSPTVNADHLIDDSIDWRGRIFAWRVLARHNAGAATFAWAGSGSTTNVPSAGFTSISLGQEQQIGWGQSFQNDLGGSPANAAAVMLVGPSTLAQLSNSVLIYVDLTTGNLRVKTTADPGANVIVWLEASGQYSNAI